MAIIVPNLEWSPVSASIPGPPSLMFAKGASVGDASGGNVTFTLPLSGAFVWLPLWVEMDVVAAAAEEVRVHYIDSGGRLESLIIYNVQGTSSTVPSIGARSSFRGMFPRGLIVRSDTANIVCTVANTDTIVFGVNARAVRYASNAAPELWAQFMTQPQ